MGWLEEVKEARAEKSLAKALAICEAERARRPNDGQIHYQIAWCHDSLGKERDAAPAYERAIELGLPEEDLRSAYLGLGSTFRCLGEYERSRAVLEKGISLFPDERALKVFLALTLYNLGDADRSMEILLRELTETTGDESIKKYGRALLFYSDKLDQLFE